MVTETERAWAQARHYMAMRRWRQALGVLQDLLSGDVRNPEIYLRMGICCFGLKEFRTAMGHCRSALECGNPDDPRVHNLMARIYQEQGEHAASERHFLQALAANPQDAWAMAGYGYLLLKAGHEKKAARVMEEAIRLDPENDEVLYLQYLYHQAKGNKPDETAFLEKIMVSGTGESFKYLSAARTAIFRGRYGEAKENLRQAFLLEPENTAILKALEALEKEGHWLQWPMQKVQQIGGPGVLWLIAVVLGSGSIYLGYITLGSTVLAVWGLYCVYTWIAAMLLRFVVRRR